MRTMSRKHTHRSIDSIEYYVQVHTHTQTHSQIQLTINQKFMFPLLRRCYCRSHSSLLSKLSAISRSLVRRMAVNCVCVRCAVRPSSYHGILLLLYHLWLFFKFDNIFRFRGRQGGKNVLPQFTNNTWTWFAQTLSRALSHSTINIVQEPKLFHSGLVVLLLLSVSVYV